MCWSSGALWQRKMLGISPWVIVPKGWCSHRKGRRTPPSLRPFPEHPPVLLSDSAQACRPSPVGSCLALPAISPHPPCQEMSFFEGPLEPPLLTSQQLVQQPFPLAALREAVWALSQPYTSAIGLIVMVPTLLGQPLLPELPTQPAAGPASGGRLDGHWGAGYHKHQCRVRPGTAQKGKCCHTRAVLY